MESEVPDILAVFFPLNWQDTMPEDEDSFINQLGFLNATGKTNLYTNILNIIISRFQLVYGRARGLHKIDKIRIK